MNPSNLSLRQKSRGTVVKTIAIHLGARDPNYIVDLTTLSNFLWMQRRLDMTQYYIIITRIFDESATLRPWRMYGEIEKLYRSKTKR